MKIFYGTYRNIHQGIGDLIIKNLLLHHVQIHKLDFTADSPLMKKHSIPIPLPGTSKGSPLGKWRIVPCALVLTLGQVICLAQTAGEAPAQPATASATPASQTNATDVVKELDAMKKRIEQLESQLAASREKDKDKDKDKQATAVAVPSPDKAAVAAPQTASHASRGRRPSA